MKKRKAKKDGGGVPSPPAPSQPLAVSTTAADENKTCSLTVGWSCAADLQCEIAYGHRVGTWSTLLVKAPADAGISPARWEETVGGLKHHDKYVFRVRARAKPPEGASMYELTGDPSNPLGIAFAGAWSDWSDRATMVAGASGSGGSAGATGGGFALAFVDLEPMLAAALGHGVQKSPTRLADATASPIADPETAQSVATWLGQRLEQAVVSAATVPAFLSRCIMRCSPGCCLFESRWHYVDGQRRGEACGLPGASDPAAGAAGGRGRTAGGDPAPARLRRP